MAEWLGVGCPNTGSRMPTQPLFVSREHSLKEFRAHEGWGCVPIRGWCY